jgi:uncharacterized protein with NRDE domain
MCTVTFIPLEDSIWLASNRDEQLDRPQALLPCIYNIEGENILFPKDQKGGGTWIAAHESGNAAVLLNGALTAHQSSPPYRKSRGLVVLELIMAESLKKHFERYDFKDIEPFTVVLYEKNELFSGWWDGKEKKLQMLDEKQPHIWSSVTLYDSETVEKRNDLFNQWISENGNPGPEEIFDFHRYAGNDEGNNFICRSREKEIFTNSISVMQITGEETLFHYQDLRSGQSGLYDLPRRKLISVTT